MNGVPSLEGSRRFWPVSEIAANIPTSPIAHCHCRLNPDITAPTNIFLLFSHSTTKMPDHAVFLIHGLWGNKTHFWYVEQQLRQTYPSLKIHACAVNEGKKTYDGIDVGADRVVAEVLLIHPSDC